MKWLAILAVIVCAGCVNETPTDRINFVQSKDSSSRVSVECVGRFDDRSAYQGYRNVYIVKDSVTETEFIGISGVGIAEAGKHGKHSTDER